MAIEKKNRKPRRPSKAKRRLLKIRVSELSLVDRHCVPDAAFIIQKRLPLQEPRAMKSNPQLREPLKKLVTSFNQLNKRFKSLELKLELAKVRRSFESLDENLDRLDNRVQRFRLRRRLVG